MLRNTETCPADHAGGLSAIQSGIAGCRQWMIG
jgi:hypothetical protein